MGDFGNATAGQHPELRVGVVGAGIIASIHLPNLRQLPGVRIAAICDADAGRAENVAAEYFAQAYSDWHQMLHEAELDALFICTPVFTRADLIERAVERGLHIYVEKPLALDLAAALSMVEAAERAGVVTCMGYMWRYAPVTERTKQLFAPQGGAMLLGRLLNGPPGPAWSFDQSLSGGLIVEFGTHMADLLRYLGGEVVLVSGVGTEVVPGPATRGPDSVALSLQFANGAVGSLQTSWAQPGGAWDIQIIAPETHLQLNLNPERVQGQSHGQAIDITSEAPVDAQPHGWTGPSWFYAAQAFINAIQTGDAALVRSSMRDGARTLALTLAATEAVRTGQVVSVEQI